MKFKYVLLMLALFALIACVHAEPFTPDEGIFAFRQVDIYEINGVNFTVPTDYELIFENLTEKDFRHDKDKLKISVVEGGKIKEVKSNKTKNITSGETMFGAVEGYLVDKNGTYTFSYDSDGKLVVIKSKDMALMMGAIENASTPIQ
jgi:hypothetical protein